MKKIIFSSVVVIIICLLGAGYISTTDLFRPHLNYKPVVIAHRGGSGQWMQNSRTAVLNSIKNAGSEFPEKRYQGIEMDIVLTKDHHLVLSHDPWVHLTLCQTESGNAIGETILIRNLTLEELQTRFICGGVPDPDFPRVVPNPERIMTLKEVLDAIKSAPEMVLYLDIKIDGDLTAGTREYAQALASELETAQISNPVYIEGPTPESISTFRSLIQSNFIPTLSFPPFSTSENPYKTAILARWATKIGLSNPLEKASIAKAQAVAAPTQVMTWAKAREARENGVKVVLFTPNSREDLDKFCTWPVDVLITDFPELGHCN